MTDKLVPNRRDRRQVAFRLSDDDYAQLAAGASVLGITVSALVKRRVLGFQIPAPKFSESVARDIRVDLIRIGNNVNQIAHAANSARASGRDVDLSGWRDVLVELREAWRLLK